MPHDYAKPRKSATKRATRRKPAGAATRARSGTDGHWSWFLSGLMTGLFAAFILYLGFVRPGESPAADTASENAVEEQAEGRQPRTMEFYRDLAEREVKVDVVQEPRRETVAARTNEVEDTTRYLLQAGSFSTRQDAETRRAEVMLLNMDATVVYALVNGQGRYRVQVGPFTGRQSADTARDTLLANNIDTFFSVMN